MSSLSILDQPAQTDRAGYTRSIRADVDRLRLLHDEVALMNVVAHGRDAIPPLRELLNEREPSGIYQPRCRAAKALGMIGAHEVLLDFLKHPRSIDDDVERAGEDAVISAVGRALAPVQYSAAYETLKSIASKRPCLMGVVAALGAYRRADSIPVLVAALAEDASRPVVEAVLVAIGEPAVPALIEAATSRPPDGEIEYSIQARKRRSALKLLGEIGMPVRVRAILGDLMADRDKWARRSRANSRYAWAAQLRRRKLMSGFARFAAPPISGCSCISTIR